MPDGHTLVTDQCGSISLWDLDTWQRMTGFEMGKEPLALTINPDGNHVLVAFVDGSLELLNLPANPEVQQLRTDVPLISLDISPDGERLLTGSFQGGVAILWNVKTGQEIRRYPGHEDAILVVGFSPDGQQAIVGSMEWGEETPATKLVLLDIETGNEILLPDQGYVPRAHAFSPDGRWLLTGSMGRGITPTNDAGDLVLWDTQTGNHVRTFQSSASVFAILFSDDGRYVYTGSNVQYDVVNVWNVATGQQVDRLDVPGGIMTLLLGTDKNTCWLI